MPVHESVVAICGCVSLYQRLIFKAFPVTATDKSISDVIINGASYTRLPKNDTF